MDPAGKPYRFGFLLNTSLGNMTRYVNLRKYAERDGDVEFVWAPASHYTPPDHPSRLRFLPEPLFMRARVMQQAQPVLGELGRLDAVMVHLFEGEVVCALRSYLSRRPILISATDEAPIVDPDTYPMYPQELAKSRLRRKLRLMLDLWRMRRFHQFVPFSEWAARILVEQCGVPAAKVHPMHVGMDLELWKSSPKARVAAGSLPRILFVGGDFVRKGGALLLDVFAKRFQGRAELHLVSKQTPAELPPGVRAYRDFEPNDARLIELYAASDLMVVPTRADIGPVWAVLEGMAMRLPIICCDTGAVPEQVMDGTTGILVGVDDPAGLTAAIDKLLNDEALRIRMGEQGRALVESRYNAETNVPLMLQLMKNAVDADRQARPAIA